MQNKKPKLPKAGNTQELLRLEKLLAEANDLKDRILEDKKKVQEEFTKFKQKYVELEKSYENIVKENTKLKKAVDLSDPDNGELPAGYVEIATCPYNGRKPIELKVNGAVVPRRIDEDGIVYERVPVKTAIALMSDGSGFKRYLIGPKDKIEGTLMSGLYTRKVSYKRHKKDKDKITGKYSFYEVEIEEGK